MMEHHVTGAVGPNRRRMRVGRGESAGKGKTCGRGHKGFKSRAGSGPHPLHEGGQMPLFRRMPKRGFSNVQFRTEYAVVNLDDLERAFEDGASADFKALLDKRLIDGRAPVKLLGRGELKKKLTVEAHACSAAARRAVEKAGGVLNLLQGPSPADKARGKRGAAQKGATEPKPTRLEKKRARRSSAS
jgi:large subunit ribosomal protein L15